MHGHGVTKPGNSSDSKSRSVGSRGKISNDKNQNTNTNCQNRNRGAKAHKNANGSRFHVSTKQCRYCDMTCKNDDDLEYINC